MIRSHARTIELISNHEWAAWTIDSWPFRIGGPVAQRPVDGPFTGSSGEVVRQMASGGGIARLGRFHVAADLAAGRLVEVLSPFNPGDGEDIHALYNGHQRLALRVRAFPISSTRSWCCRGDG